MQTMENVEENITFIEKYGDIFKVAGLLIMIVGLIIFIPFYMSRIVKEMNEQKAQDEAKSSFIVVVDNGIKTITDKETGCKYIQGSGGAVTPMLDRNGLPICGSR